MLHRVLRVLTPALAMFLGLASSHRALAHSMGQSGAMLDFHGDAADLDLQLPPSRPEMVYRDPLRPDTMNALSADLDSDLLARVHATTPSGAVLRLSLKRRLRGR